MIHSNAMRLIPVFLLCTLMAASPAMAQSKAGHKAELTKVEADLKDQKDRQETLKESRAQIEEKLETMRAELIDVSSEVQKHERVILKLHDEQAITNAKIKETSQNLDEQRESLAHTIIALQRLNRMPPQALLARPTAPIDMARSFGLLQQVIPAVSEKAQEMKLAFNELQALQADQKRQEQDLAAEKQKLETRQAKLEKIVRQRKTLLARNQKDQEAAARQVAALASRAGNLKDLMQKLDREEATRRQQKAKTPSLSAPKQQDEGVAADTDFAESPPPMLNRMKRWIGKAISNLGSARMPVTGHIATAYGQEAAEGIISRGVTIAAQPGAIVTAPSRGTVRFAGPFRQYKLLVIIQHPNGEHSLLGGMQELYTRTGARIDAGEPLGKLSTQSKMAGDSNGTTSLYYERRRNGKPIDPRTARG